MTERRRYRPKRRLVSELPPLAVVVALTAAVISIFPRDCVRFKPSEVQKPTGAVCSFVKLSREEETRALAAARTAWQSDGSRRRLTAKLVPQTLPDSISSPLLPLIASCGTVSASESGYRTPLSVDGLSAPSPVKLPADGQTAVSVAPAFPEKEMLKLD